MKLTTMTDYGLRLLMHVAQQEGRLCTITEVATRYAISEAHLMKITHQLALGGFLETLRGKGGGMRLARPAAQIRVGDVVRHLETDLALVECFADGNACTLTRGCRLAGVLDEALAAFMARLDAATLADLLPRAGPPSSPDPRRVRVAAPASRRARP